MGSGRGRYHRAAFILKRNQSLLEFKNFDYHYIIHIRRRIYFRLSITLQIKIKSYLKLRVS